jgi:hypothetical protein
VDARSACHRIWAAWCSFITLPQRALQLLPTAFLVQPAVLKTCQQAPTAVPGLWKERITEEEEANRYVSLRGTVRANAGTSATQGWNWLGTTSQDTVHSVNTAYSLQASMTRPRLGSIAGQGVPACLDTLPTTHCLTLADGLAETPLEQIEAHPTPCHTPGMSHFGMPLG